MLTALRAGDTRVHRVLQQKLIAAVSNTIDILSVGGGRGARLERDVGVDVEVTGTRHFDRTVVEDEGSAVVLTGWFPGFHFQWDFVCSVHR